MHEQTIASFAGPPFLIFVTLRRGKLKEQRKKEGSDKEKGDQQYVSNDHAVLGSGSAVIQLLLVVSMQHNLFCCR